MENREYVLRYKSPDGMIYIQQIAKSNLIRNVELLLRNHETVLMNIEHIDHMTDCDFTPEELLTIRKTLDGFIGLSKVAGLRRKDRKAVKTATQAMKKIIEKIDTQIKIVDDEEEKEE